MNRWMSLDRSVQLAVTVKLDWLWIALLAAAVLFLLVVIILLVVEIAKSGRKVKALTESLEPSLEQVQQGMKATQDHLAAVTNHVDAIQENVQDSIALIQTDMSNIREVADLAIDTTTSTTGDLVHIVGQTSAVVSSSIAAVKALKRSAPSKRRKLVKKADKKAVKKAGKPEKPQSPAVTKTEKKPSVKIAIEIDNKPKAIAKGVGFVRRQKRNIKRKKKLVYKKGRQMKQRGKQLVAGGRKRIQRGKKQFNRIRRKVS